MPSADGCAVISRHLVPRSSARKIAPFSVQPSSRLRLLVGFFAICGGIGVVAAVALAISVVTNPSDIGARRPTLLWTALLFFLSGLAWLAISRLLHHRRRTAGWWALAALLLPVLSWFQGTGMSVGGGLLLLVGLVLVVSVWGELREGDEREEE
jgi:uncharacterized membrane protein YhaH (DUF805 family)